MHWTLLGLWLQTNGKNIHFHLLSTLQQYRVGWKSFPLKRRCWQLVLTGLRTSGSVSHNGNTMGSRNRYVACLRRVSGHSKDSGSFSSSSSALFPSSSSPPSLSSSSLSLELSSSLLSSSALPSEPSDPSAAACRRDHRSEASQVFLHWVF